MSGKEKLMIDNFITWGISQNIVQISINITIILRNFISLIKKVYREG